MTQVEAMFERYGPKYRLYVTITVLLGLVALGMSITIVNVATPYIKGAFGMSASQVQWLSTGFLAATTVTLLISPWLMSAFGQRKTYVGLLLVFIAASFMGGWATGMGMIIAARVVQGAMTGVIRPVALEALFAVYPPEKRGLATAIYGMSLGLPLTLASVVGGYLVDHFNWRYVFFIVLPVCAAAILMGLIFLPDREETGRKPKLDWIGAVVLFIAIFSALAAIANGQRWGWGDATIHWLEAIAIVGTGFFIWWEPRQERPILDLDIFKTREFLAGSIVLFLFGGAFYGVMYLLPQFMDAILSYSPITSGELFVPSTFVLAVLVPLVGKFSDRIPTHWITVPALAVTAYATWRFAQADWNSSYFYLSLSMALVATGMATVPPPTLSRSIGSLPPRLISYGSGAINFALQLGGAFGTVALVAMIDRRTALHSAQLTHQGLTPGNPMAMEAMRQYGEIAQRTGTSDVYRQAAASDLLSRVDATWATIYAYQDGFLMVAVALAAVIVPSYLLSRWGQQRAAARRAAEAQ
ncbi:DHA2 family efflux MFS transporter permease subunit [Salinisphaera hydrothermalis]|uniref:Drug resistance transporter EmrB/QacA subfamily protein n=1 Tax=Salinisphaera hydrothermalis (strain C41B8) TaxID=1304275 RepID=A0A084IPR3_SALHC|nr:DHA2 family efflux MFS transporter permease subunit [Salinisphaera hydrothermalis]KEZ78697.1 drug resistance transporter EmrB/QacA subfamily protein [Salinisphaera hydrothermalis C41B8]